jgi:hypothetical protein
MAELPGFVRTATRTRRGRAAFRISSLLALISDMKNDEPVMLPPGRAIPVTIPVSTGLPTIVITIGTVP